jgi:predicted ArsR family transcriptional regulator
MRQGSTGLAAVSSLDDPVRARLYRVVAESGAPVGRDEAAAAAGIGRPLAAYHLDKLVELGLLAAAYRRPAGRSGPGAGRPAKVYTRSQREFAVSVPPRDYELAARLLAVAVQADAGGPSWAALRDAAWQFGCSLGRRARPREPRDPAEPGQRAMPGQPATPGQPREPEEPAGHGEPGGPGAADAAAALESVLRDHGFEPWRDEAGTVRLRNCPFHSLAALHPEMVCGMNLAMIQGLVEGLEATGLSPELNPPRGQCCVVIPAGQPQTGEK